MECAGGCDRRGSIIRYEWNLHDERVIVDTMNLSNDYFPGRSLAGNDASVGAFHAGKTLLVTGSGGCIGSALVKTLAAFQPRLMVLLDHSEQNLHHAGLELASIAKPVRHVSILGDILDGALVNELFESYGPDIIYHAAAFKHVPLMESNPIAVVRNNAIGTWQLAKAAVHHSAECFIMISTDKAVNPRSVMGAAKRVAELALARLSVAKTAMSAVRLGNVLGSHGSASLSSGSKSSAAGR